MFLANVNDFTAQGLPGLNGIDGQNGEKGHSAIVPTDLVRPAPGKVLLYFI